MAPFIRWLKWVFSVLALGSISVFAWLSHTQILQVFQERDTSLLVASMVAWALLHTVSPLTNRWLFQSIGHSLAYSNTLSIHIRNLPAKYLPGGIWHSVARVVNYAELGIPKRDIGAYVVVENLLIAATALGLGGALTLLTSAPTGVWYWIILGLVLASTVVFLALPFMGASRGMTLKPMWYGGTFLLNTGYWALTALSFALFMQALPGATSGDAQVSLGGVYIFSWGIGFITPFAPQGIGVSEAVSSQLIHSDLSGGSLFVLVASFRVVVLCGDLSVWLAFWIYWALRSRIQALRRK